MPLQQAHGIALAQWPNKCAASGTDRLWLRFQSYLTGSILVLATTAYKSRDENIEVLLKNGIEQRLAAKTELEAMQQ